jgi:hypothetical protein
VHTQNFSLRGVRGGGVVGTDPAAIYSLFYFKNCIVKIISITLTYYNCIYIHTHLSTCSMFHSPDSNHSV